MPTASLNTVVEALRAGKPAIFPTDTVYGLGVAVGYACSPEVLFKLKRRSAAKPVAWLVENEDALATYGGEVPRYAAELACQYWPGAITLIVPASAQVPRAFQSEAGSIGLRMPNCAETLELIAQVGCPLATSSANISGEQPPCTLAEVSHALRDTLPSLAAETACSGVASTVVDCTGAAPVVLRQGPITISV